MRLHHALMRIIGNDEMWPVMALGSAHLQHQQSLMLIADSSSLRALRSWRSVPCEQQSCWARFKLSGCKLSCNLSSSTGLALFPYHPALVVLPKMIHIQMIGPPGLSAASGPVKVFYNRSCGLVCYGSCETLDTL
jgi:hypothetical protein